MSGRGFELNFHNPFCQKQIFVDVTVLGFFMCVPQCVPMWVLCVCRKTSGPTPPLSVIIWCPPCQPKKIGSRVSFLVFECILLQKGVDCVFRE